MDETKVSDQADPTDAVSIGEASAFNLLLMGVFSVLIRQELSLGFPKRRGQVTNLEELDPWFLYRLPFTP